MRYTIAGMLFDGTWFAQGSVIRFAFTEDGTLAMFVERSPGNIEPVTIRDVASVLTSKAAA